jgi:hypothetical protein
MTFPENECHPEISKSIRRYFNTGPPGFEKTIDLEPLKVLEGL